MGKLLKRKHLERLQKFESSVYPQGTNKMTYNTSHGYLIGFLKSHAFHNVKIQGESADENATKNYPDAVEKIIQESRSNI